MIELISGDTRVTVDPLRGGALTRYRSLGPDGPVDWLMPGTKARPGCFPLIPFASRIRDGRFRITGRTVQLPANNLPEPHAIHGQAWQNAWSVVSRSAHAASIEFHHPADAWPWAYRARQSFTLDGRALRIRLAVENLSADPMPAGMGLHPYFSRTPRTEIRAQVTSRWLLDDALLPIGSIPVDHEVSDNSLLRTDDDAIDAVFSGWDRQVSIDLPERSARIVMTASEPLHHLVIFSETGSDWICVEPISNVVDAFNLNPAGNPDYLYQVIAPGEWLQTEVLISPGFV